MDIVICGAGHVGSHAAEVLAGAGHNITVIDVDRERLERIRDTLDVRTLCGNCSLAGVLLEAGAGGAELVLAATNHDEVNLLTASIAKGVGAVKVVARVHHSAYFEGKGLDYRAHLAIDQLICPEYSTAVAIAQTLRNPGALAVEQFARGQIEMEEFTVSDDAGGLGKPLAELALPGGCRLAAIRRGPEVFIPDGQSVVSAGDVVILVGNTAGFPQARRFFQDDRGGHRRVVIMGGPSMAVWLCRALRERDFSLRLFEMKRARAEELAQKLDWVTVIQADPTDPGVFEEEHLAEADAFVALVDDDEQNILGCAWAKSMGVPQAIAVVQRPSYLHLLRHVGIDRAFSPRVVAVREIEQILVESPLRCVSSLAEGVIDVYSVQVNRKAKVVGKPLREVKLTPDWVVAAIQRGDQVRVPGAEDTLQTGDTVLLIGRHGLAGKLKKMFAVG
ncbi:MAG TPA: Trk system potassium transporter TrkA [Phycisphaerae bacterium]|nr:Trk system potassium transporter TrkA [Phycisphaerae bacterium]HNU44123.1 Trk system potassium transporter TrkA [Phycisphaerae bacterium]